jgi:hypothetical protein
MRQAPDTPIADHADDDRTLGQGPMPFIALSKGNQTGQPDQYPKNLPRQVTEAFDLSVKFYIVVQMLATPPRHIH